MTSLDLLFWITGGVLLQLALYGCIVFWRHWQAYRALRNVAAEFDIAVNAEPEPELMPTASAAWAGYRTFHVERKVVEDASAQVCSFYLVPEDKKPLPAFLPGQFLTFMLDIPSPTGGTHSVIRCYSLSDAPHPSHYRITVKRTPAPLGSPFPPGQSSNYLHDQVEVGSQLQVRAPAGHFYLDPSDAPVVLIGGGIGITPLLSMLNGCLAAQPGRELWLFYGVRNRAELVMAAQLQALAAQHACFHLHLCLSNPLAYDLDRHRSGPVHTHHSRVDVALLRRLLPLKPYHFYICGPTPLLQSLVPALVDWGVPDGRIHFEAFGPASIPRKKPVSATPDTPHGDDNAVEVSFARSGRQVPWQPGMGSLLDFAEGHGIAVSSGCRSGACGTCQTRIRTGEVVYTQAPDFDPEPGSCLLCVCTPKTALTLEV
jgi:hypothetical protein